IGIRKMREGRFAEAVEIFESLPAEVWKQEYVYYPSVEESFPLKEYLEFAGSTAHNLFDPPPTHFKLYNKLTFAREAAELLKAAQSTPEHADVFYMRLGNLFYHTPYWGYNEYLWDGQFVTTARFLGTYFPLSGKGAETMLQQKLNDYLKDYGSRNLAERFFRTAAEVSKNPETVAKALILAHECSQTALTSLHTDWGRLDTLTPYLARLTREFSHTEVYKKLPYTCPDLAKFLKVST
ncbi:MAG: hypothetical protein RMM53_05785, partial [Bacteroidia bacterium]|nr:hypothetical protein [Bacteroidia bacterium]